MPSAHGVGLFCDSIPSVYDENYLRIDEPVSATVHVSEADALMEPFWHRRVTFDAPADHLAAGFEELGWTQTGHVVMAHVRDPDRFVDTSHIREVSLDEIAVTHNQVTLGESHGTTELAEQLLWAKRRTGDAIRTRYFAALDAGDGRRVLPALRRRPDRTDRGCEHARRPSRPRPWTGRRPACARRGEAGLRPRVPRGPRRRLAEGALREARLRRSSTRRQLFLRTPHPLTRLRVRTPRLELRLATMTELRLLAQVARAGHPRPGLHAVPDRLDRRDHGRELPRLAPQCAAGLAPVRLAPRAHRVPREPPGRLPGPDGEAVRTRTGARRPDRGWAPPGRGADSAPRCGPGS